MDVSLQAKDVVTPAKTVDHSVLTSPHLQSFDGTHQGSGSFAN